LHLRLARILEIASDDLIAPLGNNLTHYDFTVPEDAVNPRLIGHYNVASGLDLEVAVTLQIKNTKLTLSSAGPGSMNIYILPGSM
jgi:hypothetical protein